ncbi:2-amino-4-hydroxy-6-hydroxymethyldihydropteridine diphosphokinase [bacterium]|nr:2-amino-4-hydroxy-6-hydroxymethyldihydropteridine diphosphokinase [bacterium]
MKTFLSLGSNLGDKLKNLKEAVNQISQNKEIQVVKVSSVYETEPFGKKDQDFFLNIAVELETTLSPQNLLKMILEIETKLGRERKERFGARTIDIDILVFGNLVVCEENLKIPHPEMGKRNFVLEPLNEIAGNYFCEHFGMTFALLLENCSDSCKVIINEKLKIN